MSQTLCPPKVDKVPRKKRDDAPAGDAGKPASGKNKNDVRFNIRAPQDFIDRLERAAGRWGLSVAAYIRTRMIEVMNREDKDGGKA